MQAQLLDLQQALQLGLAQQDHALQAQAEKHQQAVGEAQDAMHSQMTEAHAELQQQQRELAKSVADLGVSTFGNPATRDAAVECSTVPQEARTLHQSVAKVWSGRTHAVSHCCAPLTNTIQTFALVLCTHLFACVSGCASHLWHRCCARGSACTVPGARATE